MYNKSTNFGDYYKECILKMLLSYGNYDYADETELDGYREAVHKMVDFFISDYREYCESIKDLCKTMGWPHDKNSDNV